MKYKSKLGKDSAVAIKNLPIFNICFKLIGVQ